MEVLLGLSLAFLGILTGIYVSGVIHDHRIADLTAIQYSAMHQMRDKTFRRVMPAVGLTVLALVAASAIFAVSPGGSRVLAVSAVALLMADMAFTVTRQVPLNAQVQNWTEGTIPPDWVNVRDQWAVHHRVRVGFVLIAYACFLAAVLLSRMQ